jgi:glucose-6-phosphate isomerase
VAGDGYATVVLLGMGGSSLAPEVLYRTFGAPAAGALRLIVLDTTDPWTIHSFEQLLDLRRTIFVVASKSGTTIETASR